MNRKPFKFKQFSIFQDKTAMKVGTDGVLLGAWATSNSGNTILDIGTGTGLISMMLAQRFPESQIDAIEIDENAYYQAKENFENAPFYNRLSIYLTSLQDYKTDKKYDLIVSNPPFFTVNDLNEFDARKQARQEETLTFSDLLEKTAQLLNKDGLASFIIPHDRMLEFCAIAAENALKVSKTTLIKGNETSPIKRVLLEFSLEQKEIEENTLTIEIERHRYTNDYVNLTKDFYLKM